MCKATHMIEGDVLHKSSKYSDGIMYFSWQLDTRLSINFSATVVAVHILCHTKFNLKKTSAIHSSYMVTATTSIQVVMSVSSTLYELVVWLSVSPLHHFLSVSPSQLFSSGSLIRLIFFKTSAPMLETRVGANREMMTEGWC